MSWIKKLFAAARIALVATIAVAVFVFPANQATLVAVLLVMIAAELLFEWLKTKWKRGTRDFEKIMEEELG